MKPIFLRRWGNGDGDVYYSRDNRYIEVRDVPQNPGIQIELDELDEFIEVLIDLTKELKQEHEHETE